MSPLGGPVNRQWLVWCERGIWLALVAVLALGGTLLAPLLGLLAALVDSFEPAPVSASAERVARVTDVVEAPVRRDLGQYFVGRRRLALTEKEVEERLEEPAEVAFVDTPLIDAVKSLERQHGLQIWIDEFALQDEGASTQSKVSLNVRGVSLRNVFRHLFEPLSLAVVYHDGLLRLTTIISANELFVTRIYSVRGLVTAEMGRRPTIEADRFAELIRLSTTGEWSEDAGTGGTLSILTRAGLMVVYQTPSVHREIQELLQGLRTGIAEATHSSEFSEWDR